MSYSKASQAGQTITPKPKGLLLRSDVPARLGLLPADLLNHQPEALAPLPPAASA